MKKIGESWKNLTVDRKDYFKQKAIEENEKLFAKLEQTNTATLSQDDEQEIDLSDLSDSSSSANDGNRLK